MAACDASSHEVEKALVEWVNTFPLRRPIRSLEELKDGHGLWEMLQDIDELWFSGDLPNDDWSNQAQYENLRFVHDHIHKRLRTTDRHWKPHTAQELQRISRDGTEADMLQFLRMVLLVILNSAKLPALLEKFRELPEAILQVVGSLMQEMSGWNSDISSEGDESTLPSEIQHLQYSEAGSQAPDPRIEIFQLEEQYAKIVSQLQSRNRDYELLEAEHLSISQRLARAQDANGALTSQVVERDEQLKRFTALNSQREQNSVKELEYKISQQEELISGYEADIARARELLTEGQRENKRLTAISENLQRMQDEFDATRLELERQTRKANTADKYLQKLQASHSIEKERDTLRKELEDTRASLFSNNKLRSVNMALQRSNDEVSRTLAQIERENEELRITSKQFRLDRDKFAQQVESLHEKSVQDQEIIAGTRDSRKNAPSSSLDPSDVILENELSESSNWMSSTKSRIYELEKEIERQSIQLQEQEAAASILQDKLSSAERSSNRNHIELEDLKQEKTALQTSLAQAQRGQAIEGTEVSVGRREEGKEIESECSNLNALVSRLREENEMLQRANRPEVSRSRGNLPVNQVEELPRTTSEPQKVVSVSQAVSHNLETLKRQSSRQLEIERGRSSVEDPSERLEQHTQLEHFEHLKQNMDVPLNERPFVKNLEREGRLMSSAFHDLAGRLQLNNIVLQRKIEGPKNWLGRQRQYLEGPIGFTR